METPDTGLVYKIAEPEPGLLDFVERFYMVINTSASDKEVVLIPDGRIDLFFIVLETGQFIGTLIGIETQPTTASFPPKCIFIGMSLKLLSIEYILHTTIAEILNGARKLPNDFWSITSNDLNNFDSFCKKISKGIPRTKQT